jgi:putative aldouronate transport system permease protein
MVSAFKKVMEHLKKYYILHLMCLPTVICVLLFSYAPMLGLVMAFQDFNISKGILKSPFVGFRNFEFLFSTEDAWRITRNTVGYNAIFIVLNMFLAVTLAILLSWMVSKKLSKFLQTVFIMPHFISMAVVAIIVFAFLSPTNGYLNKFLVALGYEKHSWYLEYKYWPFILIVVNAWKHVGYSAVVYTASISGISHELYEAAILDGASHLQQARYITIPHLRAMMTIMLILNVGSIFRGDFGLFYLVPQDSGVLYSVTDVIDTYIYRALITFNNTGMATAAGLYQSIVGLILVLISNKVVTKIEPEHALF